MADDHRGADAKLTPPSIQMTCMDTIIGNHNSSISYRLGTRRKFACGSIYHLTDRQIWLIVLVGTAPGEGWMTGDVS
jgi:hypothetical protein